MGLPKIDIVFKSKASSFIKRGSRGVVALILRDSDEGLYEFKSVLDIPEHFSQKNKKYLADAFIGNDSVPEKVIGIVIGKESELAEALYLVETCKYNYLAFPEATKEENLKIVAFIKEQRDRKSRTVKAVVYQTKADHEGIINFTTSTLIDSEGQEVPAESFTARIAGLIAGTSFSRSTTYSVIKELSNVERLEDEEANERIDAGEFILIHDGEKVKVARGINSLTTLENDKNSDYQKILLIDKRDMWTEDVRRTIADEYVGRYSNSYDNKALLITAIQLYNQELENEGILDDSLPEYNQVGINIEMQRKFLEEHGEDVSQMDTEEIKKANTKDKVFILSNPMFTDAMEEFFLQANV